MNPSILATIDRAVAACTIDPENLAMTQARIRLKMIEVVQTALNLMPDTQVRARMKAIESVLEGYVGCSADRLVVRHIDLLRQQPVDLDKLMLAVGGEWAAKARSIIIEEGERKLMSKAFVDRHATAAPMLGFRDQNGKLITEQQAKERVQAAGGSAE